MSENILEDEMLPISFHKFPCEPCAIIKIHNQEINPIVPMAHRIFFFVDVLHEFYLIGDHCLAEAVDNLNCGRAARSNPCKLNGQHAIRYRIGIYLKH